MEATPNAVTRANKFRHPRRVWWRPASGVLVLGALLLLPARPGTAYRFYRAEGFHIPPAAYAARWDAAVFPLTFRVLDNDLRPGSWSLRTVRTAILEGLSAWNEVPTSTARAELSLEALVADRTGVHGVNEIGFSAELDGFHRPGTTRIFGDWSGGIHECDIAVNPNGWEGARTEVRPWFEYVLMHEIGHCLGLHHSEPYPLADWAGAIPDTFSPPPLMAHSWTAVPELAEDDRAGLTLLYPTLFSSLSHGAVAGRVVLEGAPVRFAYVQALRTGIPTGAGPGTFTDENGEFLLEGLLPGSWLLWMHPLLITHSNPHPRLVLQAPAGSHGRTAIRDQWRWVTATAGDTLVIPDIEAVRGRRVPPS